MLGKALPAALGASRPVPVSFASAFESAVGAGCFFHGARELQPPRRLAHHVPQRRPELAVAKHISHDVFRPGDPLGKLGDVAFFADIEATVGGRAEYAQRAATSTAVQRTLDAVGSDDASIAIAAARALVQLMLYKVQEGSQHGHRRVQAACGCYPPSC